MLKNLLIKCGYAVVLSSLLFSSCRSDLLDTVPTGGVGSANMWTTDNLTDLGVSGVYSALRLGITTGSASGRELYHFDRLVTSQSKGADALMRGTATSGESLFSNVWQEMYEGIHRSNDALMNIPVKSPSAPEKKARLMAEVRFLRAYYYFRLNQVFKGVPIYLEPVSIEETTKARASEAEVWKLIIDELTLCIDEEQLPTRYATGDPNYGRITKSAAYALRGKAYMYTQEWELAIADFEKVEEAGHKLFPDYQKLFLEENEQSDEMIFAIQNIPVQGFGSTTQFITGTRSSFGSCWNTYIIHPDLVDAYDNKDGKPFNWDDIIPGYKEMAPQKREVFFLRNNLTAAEYATMQDKGLDMSLYLPNGNEQRIRKAYSNRDPRLEANVITPYASYLGREIEGADRVFTSRWPHRDENPPTLDLTTDSRALFYYLHRKFVYQGSHQLPDRVSGGIDFPIIRYADVLLMRAEALNELGRTEDAITLVNLVRQRAGVGLLNSSAETIVQGQNDLRLRIRKERRLEFPNEGISYFDELRWKSWKETSFYAGNGSKQIWGQVVTPYIWQGDNLYSWAIPKTERERNTNLTQNTGWVD